MSRWIPAVFFVALLAAISFVAERDSDPDRAGLPTAGIEREEVYGHAAQESMLASVHHPYGVSPPPQVLADLEEILLQYPGEGDDPQSARRSLSEWELIGPAGMVVRGSNPPEYNSGRIRDMDLTSAGLRVAAASGGLWEWFLNFPVPLSDNDVTTQWIGSFDTHPEASDIIVLATGEPGGTGGTGVWRTDDGGANWTQTLTGSLYSQAHRLRFDPFDDQIVHLATTSGYFRSDDGGVTWGPSGPLIRLTGDVTDLALDPVNQGVVYASVRGTASSNGGPVKSVDGGSSWAPITAGGWPNQRVDHVALTLSAADPKVVYASVTEPNPAPGGSGQTTVGVFKSPDSGLTWEDVSPDDGYHWGQGYYNNVIAASPTDASRVLVGGGAMLMTEDGGETWIDVDALHADQHAILWHPNGIEVWVGNDGGVFYSDNTAKSFTSTINLLPITQYWFADVCPTDCSMLIGGSQDNGVSHTTTGISWEIGQGGDGGGVAVNQHQCYDSWSASGAFGDGIDWHRFHSEDAFGTWVDSNIGLPPDSRWYTRMRHEPTRDVVYTHTRNLVYESINGGVSWTPKGLVPFTQTIQDISVSTNGPGGPAIYAVLRDATEGNRLWILDDDVWVNREPPTDPFTVQFRRVAPHYSDPDGGYLLANGLDGPGRKVWYTPDRGVSWENRTGDLPNVSIVDLAVHPIDHKTLYLATTTGMWTTNNGGVNWIQFNNGLPLGLMMTELRWCVENWFETGTFKLIAASYGRSMWERDVLVGADPTAAPPGRRGTRLDGPSPNPFNPNTTIRFDLEREGTVRLEVFDARGRRVRTLLDEHRTAGPHAIEFDGTGLASGVYHCRMVVGGEAFTKPMALIK